MNCAIHCFLRKIHIFSTQHSTLVMQRRQQKISRARWTGCGPQASNPRVVLLTSECVPQRKSRKGSSVIESYCGACGVFIAASSGNSLLELAERLHRCAGASWDGKPGQFSSAEARIV